MSINAGIDISHQVDVIYSLLNILRKNNPALAKWANPVLKLACRKLEVFAVPSVSVEAANRAAGDGVPGDLSDYCWEDHVKDKKMRDKGRKIFHWDHVYPVSQMVQALKGINPLDKSEIERVARLTAVAWILKCENTVLDLKGYRSNRPSDPLEAYKECGIELV